MLCPFCKSSRKDCGCWYIGTLGPLLVMATTFAISTGACGHAPIPQNFMTLGSHVLAATQDVQQRAERVYAGLCRDRETAPDCVELRKLMDEGYQAAADALFDAYEEAQKVLGAS